MAHTAERKGNNYDSEYLAEYYDLWAEAHAHSLDKRDGAPIYISVLKELLAVRSPAPSPAEPFTILDVGTGTGRVLINIANDAEQEGLDLSNVEFIGVDLEPAMLRRAELAQQSSASMNKVGKVTWNQGEAATLSSVPSLQSKQDRLDFLFFAFGSISHLTGTDEPQRFFAEVASLLRPGLGRAYLAINNNMISCRSITKCPPVPAPGKKLDLSLALNSKVFPNIVYKKIPVDGSNVEGQIKTDYFRFSAIKRMESGAEEIVETAIVEFSLRIWEEPELLQWTKDAGLECVETFYSLHDTYYVLSRRPST